MKRILALVVIFILAIAIIPISELTVFGQLEDRIPVIILFRHDDPVKHKAIVEAQGGEVKSSFKIIHGMSAKLSYTAIGKLKSDPEVVSIDPDVRVTALD